MVLVVKNPPTMQETRVRSLGWEDLLEEEMATHLPGESHGQKSLEGYSPWGHKESDTTERLNKNNCSVAVRHELGTFSFVNNNIRFQISL